MELAVLVGEQALVSQGLQLVAGGGTGSGQAPQEGIIEGHLEFRIDLLNDAEGSARSEIRGGDPRESHEAREQGGAVRIRSAYPIGCNLRFMCQQRQL